MLSILSTTMMLTLSIALLVLLEMIIQCDTKDAKPKVIRRKMENANPFSDGSVPTSLELSNKTSQKLLRRISDDLLQDDATYRLVWQGKRLCICNSFLLVYFLNTYQRTSHFLNLKPKHVYFFIFNIQIDYLCTVCL
jgi:hypothetical protein